MAGPPSPTALGPSKGPKKRASGEQATESDYESERTTVDEGPPVDGGWEEKTVADPPHRGAAATAGDSFDEATTTAGDQPNVAEPSGASPAPLVEDARPLPPLSIVPPPSATPRAASPVPARQIPTKLAQTARLIITAGNDRGREFVITDRKTTIGRGVDNTIVLTDIAVSRHHLELVFDNEHYIGNDLGSGNGTLLNDQRVEHAFDIHDGDEIEIGNTVIRFEATSVELTPLAADSDDDMSTISQTPPTAEPPRRRVRKPTVRASVPPAPGRGSGTELDPLSETQAPTLDAPMGRDERGARRQPPAPPRLGGRPVHPRPQDHFRPTAPRAAEAGPGMPHRPGAEVSFGAPHSPQGQSLGAELPPVPSAASTFPPPAAGALGTPRPAIAEGSNGLAPLQTAPSGGSATELVGSPLPLDLLPAGAATPQRRRRWLVVGILGGLTLLLIIAMFAFGGDDNASPVAQVAGGDGEEPSVPAAEVIGDDETGDTAPAATTDDTTGDGQVEPTITALSAPDAAPAPPPADAAPAPEPEPTVARKAPGPRRRGNPRRGKPAASGAVDDAAARAATQYANREFAAAAQTARSGASGKGPEAKALARKANDYESLHKHVTRAKSQEARDAPGAMSEYRKALKADKRLGGKHAGWLRGKIAAVAPKAAGAYLAREQYPFAKFSCGLAAKYGNANDPLCTRVGNALERKAREYYEAGRSARIGDEAKAKRLFKQILKIVPASSPTYAKARAALAQ